MKFKNINLIVMLNKAKCLMGCLHPSKNTFAFSLVELMISLITISCIAAAFTPVITKRLKKQDIALSLAQTSEITSECAPFGFPSECKLCTKAYCINCEKKCGSDEYAETKTCTCKKCSTHDKIKNSPLASKCISCDNAGCIACINTGSEEGKYYINNNLCEPCGDSSKYYCDGITRFDKTKCTASSGYVCVNGIKTLCSTAVNDAKCEDCTTDSNGRPYCTGCRSYMFLNSNKKCQDCAMGGCSSCINNTYCTGCDGGSLLNTTTHRCGISCRTVNEHCMHCYGDQTNNSCARCDSGYYVNPNNRKQCLSCTSIPNCRQCTNGICTVCNQGYFVNSSNNCQQCTIQNCAVCSSSSTCISCKSGFYLSEDKKSCLSDTSNFHCSDSNFVQIGNLCITRRNMGDSNVLKIPSTVNVVDVGEMCYGITDKCCWKGKTCGGCQSSDSPYLVSSYSGCNRTACNYYAAEEICEKFNYAGKKWRLATASEAQLWERYSANLGANGLDLCCNVGWGSIDGAGLELCTDWGGRCPGAEYNNCYVCDLWTHRDNIGAGGKYAYSVRCVTEMDE